MLRVDSQLCSLLNAENALNHIAMSHFHVEFSISYHGYRRMPAFPNMYHGKVIIYPYKKWQRFALENEIKSYSIVQDK